MAQPKYFAGKLTAWCAVCCCALALTATSVAQAAEPTIPREVKQMLMLGDTAQAVSWLAQAQAAGNQDAAYELAKLYRLGNGVPKDQAKATALFESAAATGHKGAQKVLARLAAQAQPTVNAPAANLPGGPDTAAGDLFSKVKANKPLPTNTPLELLNRTNNVGTPLLVFAVQQQQSEWVTALLAQQVDLQAVDAQGNGALHHAVMVENLELLIVLLQAGVSIDAKNAMGATPLHLATAAQNHSAIGRLLKAGANPRLKNSAGWSASMIAKRTGSPKLLALFGHQKSVATTRRAVRTPASAESLFHWAALGDIKKMRQILGRGISVDASNSAGDTALNLAVGGRHIKAIDLLLEQGADPDIANLRGITPLHQAVKIRSPQMAKRLLLAGADPHLRDTAKNPVLHTAVRSGCNDCVLALVAAHANLNLADKSGASALVLAAKQGKTELVGKLLDAGADALLCDNAGRSALWWAVKKEQDKTADVILTSRAAGALVTEADLAGVIPLHLAAQNDQVELSARLTTAQTVNNLTEQGSSPLMLAAYHGSDRVLAYLLQQNVKIDQQNNLGDTPLLAAVQKESVNTALLLVKAGASLDVHNQSGQSARVLIESRDDPQWAEVLDEAPGMFAAIIKTLAD